MKKDMIKCIIFSTIVFFCSMILTISVCAEDFRCDVSSAIMTNGEWQQSFTEYTPLETDRKFVNNFNPLWMTERSEVIVEYELDEPEGELSQSPVELIWQTWDGPVEPNPDAVRWAKVAPYEYSRMDAKFSYAAIVEAYGTSDFSAVYAVNIGDTGTHLKVTSLTVTNIDKSVTEPEYAVPKRDEEIAPEEVAANAPDSSNTLMKVLIVVLIVVVAAAVIAGVSVFLKKHGNSGY